MSLRNFLALALLMALAPAVARAQAAGGSWRRIGSMVTDQGLAGPAGGPVDRVWFSADGAQLYARTRLGLTFQWQEPGGWLRADAAPPVETPNLAVARLPDAATRVVGHPLRSNLAYALGRQVARSEDGGRTWTSLTAFQQGSILGGPVRDVALSPADPDTLVAAGESGVWRSVDGGLSWLGLNESLPALPVVRVVETPREGQGLTIALRPDAASEAVTAAWVPGEKAAWRTVASQRLALERARQRRWSTQLDASLTATALEGTQAYAGAADGRLWSSADAGRTWRPAALPPDGYQVQSLAVAADDPAVAVAVLNAPAGDPRPPRVLRTLTGGALWEDLSAGLPAGVAYGVALHRATGALYVALDRSLLVAYANPATPGLSASWQRAGAGLPDAPVMDVHLDDAGHQLYVAVAGYGVYAGLAPHRLREPAVVSAADLLARVAAPGSLLTVLGTSVRAARAGDQSLPVLDSGDDEAQLQVPFEATGNRLQLELDAPAGPLQRDIPLRPTAPALFIGRDGVPLALDADSGTFLDAAHPARSGTRVQLFATGLGAVEPKWPTGVAAPAQDPPRVTAALQAYLDGAPVEVVSATLAPGHVGFYLIEIELPRLTNYGPTELVVAANGQRSNKVTLHVEP